MSETDTQRVRRLYEGELGLRWRRLVEDRPADYLEQNIAVGRRELQDRLLEWLRELDGGRLLDAGCGLGELSLRLAEDGFDVTGVDLVEAFVEAARGRAGEGGPGFEVGDFTDVLSARGERAPFDLVLLIDVLEDYEPTERYALLRAIADSGVPRLFLAFRTVGDERGTLWERLIPDDPRGIREIELLRWIHLATPFRQTRQAKVHVRNYRAHLSDLQRQA